MTEITVNETEVCAYGVRFSIDVSDREVARAYLYVLENDIHEEPFGYVEDVYVNEDERGQGLSTAILDTLEKKAKELDLYKIILHTESVNFIAQSLYTKRGWYVVGPTLRFDLKKVA